MTQNLLQLNSNKTEAMLIGSPHQLQSSSVNSVFSGQINLGVRFEPNVSFEQHIQQLCKTAFFHLRNIVKLLPLLYPMQKSWSMPLSPPD